MFSSSYSVGNVTLSTEPFSALGKVLVAVTSRLVGTGVHFHLTGESVIWCYRVSLSIQGRDRPYSTPSSSPNERLELYLRMVFILRYRIRYRIR